MPLPRGAPGCSPLSREVPGDWTIWLIYPFLLQSPESLGPRGGELRTSRSPSVLTTLGRPPAWPQGESVPIRRSNCSKKADLGGHAAGQLQQGAGCLLSLGCQPLLGPRGHGSPLEGQASPLCVGLAQSLTLAGTLSGVEGVGV